MRCSGHWSHRYQHTDAYFGSTWLHANRAGRQTADRAKTVRLNNDYIRQVTFTTFKRRYDLQYCSNFEDGVTRFIQCNAGEKVLDAAHARR